MGEWLSDLPNWLKPLPGLILLGIALIAFFNGYIWFFGWGAGVVLTCAGLLFMGKKNDYKF